MKLFIVLIMLAGVNGLSCAWAQDREVQGLAVSMAEGIGNSPRQVVGVADFTDLQGNVTELGRFLAEQLSIALARNSQGIEVVDRTHLKTLIQEHKLNASGLTDPATIEKMGQMTGVNVLVTGTITPFGDSVQVAAKALKLNTAKIVTAATTEIPRTKSIDYLLGQGISTSISVSSATPNGPPLPQTPDAPGLTKTITGVSLHLNACSA